MFDTVTETFSFPAQNGVAISIELAATSIEGEAILKAPISFADTTLASPLKSSTTCGAGKPAAFSDKFKG